MAVQDRRALIVCRTPVGVNSRLGCPSAWELSEASAGTGTLSLNHDIWLQRAMNMTEDQKRTLCAEFGRTLAGSAQLLHQREALWRQALGVQIMGRDGRLTERMSAVRDYCCPEATAATPATCAWSEVVALMSRTWAALFQQPFRSSHAWCYIRSTSFKSTGFEHGTVDVCKCACNNSWRSDARSLRCLAGDAGGKGAPAQPGGGQRGARVRVESVVFDRHRAPDGLRRPRGVVRTPLPSPGCVLRKCHARSVVVPAEYQCFAAPSSAPLISFQCRRPYCLHASRLFGYLGACADRLYRNSVMQLD